MRIKSLYIIIVFLSSFVVEVRGQPDIDPPLSPVLELVTVNQLTGYAEITWTTSSSPDVTAYVIYEYINDEGYSLDTIYNPLITYYTHNNLKPSEISVSYVVAAIDTADNISPLSNFLNTIFLTARVDTCNKNIGLEWSSYPSYPRLVNSYTILYSVNEGDYSEAGIIPGDSCSFSLNDFILDANYCFVIRANLEGDYYSMSNKTCVNTTMQKPPQWINADYAMVTSERNILISFTIDPLSEISNYILERRIGLTGSFEEIESFTVISGSLSYTDMEANISEINYYRLSAVNSCDVAITLSNIASNIVLALVKDENDINLIWNPYREWKGMVNNYSLFINTGEGYEEEYTISSSDTLFTLPYSDLMYDVKDREICFFIKAYETANPYGIYGESSSSTVCTPADERITVPNLFTPDEDLINDLFGPVFSFTPAEYHLLITDLRRNRVFETRDHTVKWDGNKDGVPVPEGVFLWFLDVTEPSGNKVRKTGTVTVYRSKR